VFAGHVELLFYSYGTLLKIKCAFAHVAEYQSWGAILSRIIPPLDSSQFPAECRVQKHQRLGVRPLSILPVALHRMECIVVTFVTASQERSMHLHHAPGAE
jgi:hypothetical protein